MEHATEAVESYFTAVIACIWSRQKPNMAGFTAWLIPKETLFDLVTRNPTEQLPSHGHIHNR